MSDNPLLQSFEKFCKSSATNVEVMDDSLRREVNINTSLKSVIELAINEGRSVVLTGTAGSGKTHLLETVGQPKGYKICRDLASSEHEWAELLLPNEACIVAGNEGALLKGAREGQPGFQQAVSALHRIQQGEDVNDGDLVVIDVAGYDPVGNHSLGEILKLDLLADYVSSKGDPIRQEAWDCLKSDVVRSRICLLLEASSSESDGFTFRQLWQMVSDIIDRGTGNEGVWFHRLIHGESAVSNKMRQLFQLSDVALPHIGNRLWQGDGIGELTRFVPEAHQILKRMLSTLPEDMEKRRKHFNDVRILSYFTLKQVNLLSGSDTVWTDVSENRVESVLTLINQYMSYGLISLSYDLLLWFEHATERRDNKSDSMFAFGKAPASEFEIRRSRCVANCPTICPEGGRRLLIHKPTHSSLNLTKELLNGIQQTRSHRNKDRRHVEFDWRLGSFLAGVATKSARKDKLTMAQFDFLARKGTLSDWDIRTGAIRKVGG